MRTPLGGEVLVIDGSFGEGGGQILRTTLALSTLTGTSVKIENIGAKRPKPGLQPQHLAAVKAVAELSEAKVTGVKEFSRAIVFEPNRVKPHELTVNVGSAGSVTLILQSLMPAALQASSTTQATLAGGTDVNWSPPFNYFTQVNLAIIRKFGFKGE